jgi:hypothetical protein
MRSVEIPLGSDLGKIAMLLAKKSWTGNCAAYATSASPGGHGGPPLLLWWLFREPFVSERSANTCPGF